MQKEASKVWIEIIDETLQFIQHYNYELASCQHILHGNKYEKRLILLRQSIIDFDSTGAEESEIIEIREKLKKWK